MSFHQIKYGGLLLILAVFILTGCAGATTASDAPVSPSPTNSPPTTSVANTPVAPTPTASPALSPSATPSTTHTPIPSPTPSATNTPRPLAAGCPCDIEHVVIISIDGLRPDALDLADTPTLDALKSRGAYHPAAQAVLPSVTLVNHASMLGGMSPQNHGITWNDYDPEAGFINGPTLFSTIKAAGLRSVMVVGKPKLQHLVLPGSVNQFIYAGFLDQQVTTKAVTVIETGLPEILFIHLPDVDTAGHLTGWLSPSQLTTITQTDGQVAKIVSALEAADKLASTLLLITADHGGSGHSHGSDSPEDRTIPWLAVGPGVPAGITLNSNIVIYDTAATALHALNIPIPPAWDGRPAKEIFTPQPGE